MRIRRICINSRAAILGAASAGLLAASSAWAGSCDVDDYLVKAIGIEEPWLENAGYLFTQVPNNGRPQAVTLAPEIEARLSDRFGMELDPPAYTAEEPLGRGPSAFGPLAAGLKEIGLYACAPSQGRATLLTGEIEGQYWAETRPSVLPGQGNSVTVQAMWAQLWNTWFSEGEAGYTQHIGSGITSGWFLNTSLGRALTQTWAVQLELELDDQLILTGGHRGLEGALMPQISYRPSSDWRLALGEQASFQQQSAPTGWSSWMMVEREFADADDPR
jgi:hypothetical protein